MIDLAPGDLFVKTNFKGGGLFGRGGLLIQAKTTMEAYYFKAYQQARNTDKCTILERSVLILANSTQNNI